MVKYLRIRSKNDTANALRKMIVVPNNAVLRLGSITPNEDIFKRNLDHVFELNTVEACKNSGSKKVMKRLFTEHEVITAEYELLENIDLDQWEFYPAIIKHYHSSKGEGIFYIKNREELVAFMESHQVNQYLIERYYSYNKEYRLHMYNGQCFYTCRKMLKRDTPEENRFHRHDNNSVWILEENELFAKPENWNEIVAECDKAMKSVGLDIGAIDIKVQSKNLVDPKFIILETNSAPSLGEITTQKYIELLNNIDYNA